MMHRNLLDPDGKLRTLSAANEDIARLCFRYAETLLDGFEAVASLLKEGYRGETEQLT